MWFVPCLTSSQINFFYFGISAWWRQITWLEDIKGTWSRLPSLTWDLERESIHEGGVLRGAILSFPRKGKIPNGCLPWNSGSGSEHGLAALQWSEVWLWTQIPIWLLCVKDFWRAEVFEDANLGRGESAGKMGMWVGVGLSQAASGDWWLCLAMKQRKRTA